jgi:hypothetical protein
MLRLWAPFDAAAEKAIEFAVGHGFQCYNMVKQDRISLING